MNRKKTIRLTESELKRVINESVTKILKEDFDYNYGSEDVKNLREIYQLAIQIEELCNKSQLGQYNYDRDFIKDWANQIMEECMRLKKIILAPKPTPEEMEVQRQTEIAESVNRILKESENYNKCEALILNAIEQYGDFALSKDSKTESIYVKINCDTMLGLVSYFDINGDNLGQKIYNRLPVEFRDRLIAFKPSKYNFYLPVFDEEAQESWDYEQKKHERGIADYYRSHNFGTGCGD